MINSKSDLFEEASDLEAQIMAYTLFETAAYWYNTSAKQFPISKYFIFRKNKLYEPEIWYPENSE